MDELKDRLSKYSEQLENNPDYEMSDEMQKEYYAIQDELEMHPNQILQKQFERLCKEYENPDGVITSSLRDMYPDIDEDFEVNEWDD